MSDVFQILTVVEPFMERKLIREIFSHNFLVLRQLFQEELEKCKQLFKSQFNQVVLLIQCYCYTTHYYLAEFASGAPLSFLLLFKDGERSDEVHGSHIWSFKMG